MNRDGSKRMAAAMFLNDSMYTTTATTSVSRNTDKLNRKNRSRRRSAGVGDEVIVPPSMRFDIESEMMAGLEPGPTSGSKTRQTLYKNATTRPMYKENAKKKLVGRNHSNRLMIDNDDNENGEHDHDNDNYLDGAESSRQRAVILDELRDEVDRILSTDTTADAIQPKSRTHNRLKRIVGIPPPSFGSPSSQTRGLDSQRFLPNYGSRIDSSSIGGGRGERREVHGLLRKSRVPSTSGLETRQYHSGGYSLERQPSDLSTIRREVNQMVDTLLLSETSRNTKGDFSPLSAGSESRDETPNGSNLSSTESSSRAGATKDGKNSDSGTMVGGDGTCTWTNPFGSFFQCFGH